MPLRLFNTYTRTVEEFTPLDPERRAVRMYTCGPTVYDFAHIGNFRAYTFEDLLQRYLEYRGYAVQRVMNLTDVDDKTIRGCRAAGLPLGEFTQTFKDAFFADLAALRIKPAGSFPAATDERYVRRMIEMITILVERGCAYQADDQSVYFRLSAFPAYGKLAHLNLDELRPTGRIRNDDYEKESLGDFALWKAWDEDDGAVAWKSPWGPGRPGWHIECSAICTSLLGDQIDIHCGGVDNIFPHHEAEIAQCESCTGRQFVRYWLHCAHLLVDGQKMAKSAGNFYTLRDLLARGFTGREVRHALLSVHYRLPLNFTFAGLTASRSALSRLDAWTTRLETVGGGGAHVATNTTARWQQEFEGALDDDLNISAALGFLFEALRESNRAMDAEALSPSDAHSLLQWWKGIDAILQLSPEKAELPPQVAALRDERQRARQNKEWSKGDELRAQIEAAGWSVKDTKQGQELSRR